MPPTLAPNIVPPVVLPTFSPNVLDDHDNTKVEVSPFEVSPPVVASVVSIDHRAQFNSKRKFSTLAELLMWVREEVRKLVFLTFIEKLDNRENARNAFVILIWRGSSYIEYKKLSKCKISSLVKYECPFRVRGYLLLRALKLVTEHTNIRWQLSWKVIKLWTFKPKWQ